MKISEALHAVQNLYIDTAPLIYYVEVNPNYIAKMDIIVDAIESKAFTAYSAVLTLTEVLVHPLRKGNDRLKQQYHNILVENADIQLLPLTARIAESAADLCARYNLRTPDALHVAAAIDKGCDAFLTNDVRLNRIKEIAVLVLDELELDSQEPEN
jgi:predicted nucleic acid-binding protein